MSGGPSLKSHSFCVKMVFSEATSNSPVSSRGQRKRSCPMFGWKPLKRLLAGIVFVGLSIVVGVSCCADRQGREGTAGGPDALPRAARQEKIDLEKRSLERIPVGTVIGKEAPEGWSNLVLFAVPTL